MNIGSVAGGSLGPIRCFMPAGRILSTLPTVQAALARGRSCRLRRPCLRDVLLTSPTAPILQAFADRIDRTGGVDPAHRVDPYRLCRLNGLPTLLTAPILQTALTLPTRQTAPILLTFAERADRAGRVDPAEIAGLCRPRRWGRSCLSPRPYSANQAPMVA